jgi:hypothetical protein
MPSAAAGVYGWAVYKQKGGSPAVTDGPPVGTGKIEWDGTAEVAIPTASDNATAAAAAILATPANKLAVDDAGNAYANLVLWDEAYPGAFDAAVRAAIGMATATLDDQLAALETAIGEQLVEGQYTRDDLLRLIAAALVGLTSGSGTDTVVFTGLDGTTARITATVSNEGNRTQMVLDGET